MRPFARILATLAASLTLGALSASAQALKYPETSKTPVRDTYPATEVADDYRWLEDARDPAVKPWSLAQLEVTRKYLDALPSRAKLTTRFKDLYRTQPVRYFDFAQRGAFFAMKRKPPKDQPMLVMMKSAGDVKSEQILLDPNALNAKGTTAIDFFEPSVDGRYVAVALSENGSEDGSAHVIDTRSGKRLPDVVPRVQYLAGAIETLFIRG